MKKKETPDQNPEVEQTSFQEENSSPVIETEAITESQLPTDTDQKTVNQQIEEPFSDITEKHEEELIELKEDPLPVPVEELQAEINEEPVNEPIEEPEHDMDKESFTGAVEEAVTEVNDGLTADLISEPATGSTDEPGSLHEENLDELGEDGHEDILAHEETEGHSSEFSYDNLSREELITQLEEAVTVADISSVKTRISMIKMAFMKKKKEEHIQKYENVTEEGGSRDELQGDQDELDIKFNDIFNIYKANKARWTEQQEKIKLDNLKKKQQILDGLKQLISSEETLKKTYDEFKNLQDQWKEIGMVPRGEINNLWQNYHFLVEKFFEKVKLNKELKDLDLRKNLEAKMALCEKTEELLLETSVLKSFKKLQKYHEEWKEIGPVPADKKEEIWERFKTATDKINELRREHYHSVETEQQKNLETKIALAEQAEAVLLVPCESVKDWQENTNRINELLKIWKGVGAVSQKQNNDIWIRFKTSLDTFFANKKEFFDKLKDQQVNNYNLKLELAMQAEALQHSTDWRKTSNDLIHLQNEWKKIGPVPKKNSDKIWKRFRAACDAFFNAKSEYFSHIQAHEEENLNKKLDLLKRLKEYQFGENKSENLGTLKNFQREWTEIGHIPIREKDKLQNEFRSIINEHLDRLRISEVEMTTLNYQTKIESIKHDPQSKHLISREKELIAGKISKMKEDINLWENNIGFFAKSKNAAILKEEFEKKINSAKSEVKVMEAKLKILRQQQ